MLLGLLACHHDPEPAPAAFALDPPVEWALDDPDYDQHHATVATVPDGTSAVAWTHRQLWEDPDSWVLPLDPHGAWAGEPVPLGDGVRDAAKPDIEADDQGRLWVAYDSYLQGVWLDRLELAAHGRESARLAIESHAVGNNSLDLALAPDGGAFVTWLVEGDAPLYTAVKVTADLVVSDPILEVDLPPTDDDGYTSAPPDVEVTPDGGAVIAYAETLVARAAPTTATAPPLRLELQRFDADATPTGDPWVVAEGGLEARPSRPTVAITPSGRVLVAWRDHQHADPTTASIWLGAYDLDGDRLLDPLRLDADHIADDVVIAAMGDDAVLVGWSRLLDPAEPDAWSVWAGVWSTDGDPIVAPTRLSSPDVGSAQRPHVAVARDGRGWRFVVSWEQQDPGQPLVTWGRTGRVTLR